jgi:hypothetical protein
MGYIEDVQTLLDAEEVSYKDFLDTLISLEREHATRIAKIKMGVSYSIEELSTDMTVVWKIGELANRLRIKIEKKLEE